MKQPEEPPNPGSLDAWRDFALAYLRAQWPNDAPAVLEAPTVFSHSPLEGEGAVAIFPFASPRAAGDSRMVVVVGETQPNYYPSYGLTIDDAFSLHLGTRFMLVMGIGQHEAAAADDYDAEDDARRIVSRVSNAAPVDAVRIAAQFNVEGQIHSVLAARVAGREVYILGRDAPMGFVERADLPAPVAYRLHLGRVLRAEPDPDGINANG